MEKIQFNFRIDTETKKKLEQIAELETKKTGYDITVSSLINKVLRYFVEEYKK